MEIILFLCNSPIPHVRLTLWPQLSQFKCCNAFCCWLWKSSFPSYISTAGLGTYRFGTGPAGVLWAASQPTCPGASGWSVLQACGICIQCVSNSGQAVQHSTIRTACKCLNLLFIFLQGHEIDVNRRWLRWNHAFHHMQIHGHTSKKVTHLHSSLKMKKARADLCCMLKGTDQ